MSKDKSDDDSLMQFVDEAPHPGTVEVDKPVWRILIIDDEKDVHSATTFALRSTEVVGRSLEFIHANSAREAKKILLDTKDIAVILLDVVMETPNAGLDLVSVIRKELAIRDTRIILRTGQPNQAPEIEVIRDYDINDYKLKSELTQARLFASLTTAIRSYKQIRTIEAGKKSLSMIVQSSADLLSQDGIHQFAQGVIMHLSGLLSISPEGLICVRRVMRDSREQPMIIAAAGHYLPLIDQPLTELAEIEAQGALLQCLDLRKNIFCQYGMALYLGSAERGDMACFVNSDAEIAEIDESLLELFCSNITICADNLQLVAQLSQFAYYDVVSGLPNRNALLKEIGRVMRECDTDHYALCLVDIDNFAEVNASLGQQYGDALLKAVGTRMRKQFPAPSMVCRVAGDTFAVISTQQHFDKSDLLGLFQDAFAIGEEEQMISVTAGIVPLEEVHGDSDEVIKDATIVLKTAKNRSRGEVVLFKREMVKDAQNRLSILRHLRSAFELEQLFLVFQPKLRIKDLAVTGFESLIRWRDPQGELVPPETFIPLAERSGFIVRLGAWIFESSVNALLDFHRKGWSQCHMSINLSVAQLQHSSILGMLRGVIDKTGVDPRFIDLEITESLAVNDFDATLELLNEIKKMGFSLSLDDFGTGYASLNHLHKMPIDYLKLDRSLIEASNSSSGREIVEMIIHLAEKLNLNVVAEGVEQRSQIDFLKSLECGHAQGFYYAKPMEKAVLYEWMENNENKNI